MIAWHKVTLLKEKGGVGLLYLNHLNTICKTKLLLKCLNRSFLLGLWCYAKYHSIWGSSIKKASRLWRNLKVTTLNLKSNLNYKLENDSLFSLYYDHWCQGKSLLDQGGNHCFFMYWLTLKCYYGLDYQEHKVFSSWFLPKLLYMQSPNYRGWNFSIK